MAGPRIPHASRSSLRYAPLLALLPGCAASARVGAQSKLLRGDVTAEAQATLATGAAGDHPGDALFVPVLTLSGGTIPATQRGTGGFEGGIDYATCPLPGLSLRFGPRVGGAWGGQAGSYGGVRGGMAIALRRPELDRWYPVIVVEALGAPGFTGDLGGTFVGGLGVAFGYEKYGSLRVPSGRPMRREEDGRLVVAPVAKRRAWRDPDTRPDVRDASRALRRTLGNAWLGEARCEHASIATFASLSMQLMACGAPPELVAGAHRAALDEVHHAKLCFALAAAYLGEEVDPGALPTVVATTKPSLARLALESLNDGALGEGSAAVLAARRRRRAQDPAVKRVLGAIAREERRHAELAWDVIAWATQRGGANVARALRAAWARQPATTLPSAAPRRVVDLSAHGLPTPRDALDAMARVRRRAAARLDALLARTPRST